MASPRMATSDPTERQPPSAKRSVDLNGFSSELRAGRCVATRGGPPRSGQLIQANGAYQHLRYEARSGRACTTPEWLFNALCV